MSQVCLAPYRQSMVSQQHQPPSKATTISRKIRNSANQDSYIYLPEPSQLSSLRTTQRRAATLSSARHTCVTYSSRETDTLAWNSSTLDAYTHITASHSTGLVQSSYLTAEINQAVPYSTVPRTIDAAKSLLATNRSYANKSFAHKLSASLK
jgi:hypothetical protein